MTTEVGDEETFIDLGARISREHGLRGQLTLLAPGEARNVKGSQRVRTVFPNNTLFHLGVIPDKKPVEAEAPAGTKGHILSIHDNTVEDDAEQDNVILYPQAHVDRAVSSTNASIHGNRASGKGKQKNLIGSPIRAGSRV